MRPETRTRPSAIQRAASLREHTPALDSTRARPWRTPLEAFGFARPRGAWERAAGAAGGRRVRKPLLPASLTSCRPAWSQPVLRLGPEWRPEPDAP